MHREMDWKPLDRPRIPPSVPGQSQDNLGQTLWRNLWRNPKSLHPSHLSRHSAYYYYLKKSDTHTYTHNYIHTYTHNLSEKIIIRRNIGNLGQILHRILHQLLEDLWRTPVKLMVSQVCPRIELGHPMEILGHGSVESRSTPHRLEPSPPVL